MDGTASSPGFDDDARRHRRIALGLALSLILHALLLWAYRAGLAPPPADDGPAPRSIAVWLRPPEPVPVPQPEPRSAPPAAPPAPARAHRPRATQHRAAPIIAVTPAQSGQPPTLAQEPAAAGETPRFDPEAARKFARRIALERDPARAGTAVGQFPDKPYATETKAARAIGAAHRPDCKDGLPGGLLAPIYLMLEKKDSDCKW